MAKALVLYHSQSTGNTAALAEAISAGLKEGGCVVDTHNTNDSRFDITRLRQYDCVAFGSPDYSSAIAGGMKMVLDDYYIANVLKKMDGLTNKPYILFYTHGGGGKIKEVIAPVFAKRGIGPLIGEPIGCQDKPGPDFVEKAKALGKELAEYVQKDQLCP
jgi:flavodoxin